MAFKKERKKKKCFISYGKMHEVHYELPNVFKISNVLSYESCFTDILWLMLYTKYFAASIYSLI